MIASDKTLKNAVQGIMNILESQLRTNDLIQKRISNWINLVQKQLDNLNEKIEVLKW